MPTNRYGIGDRVLLTRTFGDLERPFEVVIVVDVIPRSMYSYVIRHDDGTEFFAMDHWLQPVDFTITEDVEINDLLDVYTSMRHTT